MESLARFFVAAAELFEAEGRALKRQIVSLIVAAGLGCIILGLVVTGLGCLLFCLFRALAELLTPTGAVLAVGVIAMLLAWAGLLYAGRMLRWAMSAATKQADASPAQAKAGLIEAASAVGPVAAMRRHPFVSVGVAAGVGAALGTNRERRVAPGSLARAISWLVRLVAPAIGRYAVAKANQAAMGDHGGNGHATQTGGEDRWATDGGAASAG